MVPPRNLLVATLVSLITATASAQADLSLGVPTGISLCGTYKGGSDNPRQLAELHVGSDRAAYWEVNVPPAAPFVFGDIVSYVNNGSTGMSCIQVKSYGCFIDCRYATFTFANSSTPVGGQVHLYERSQEGAIGCYVDRVPFEYPVLFTRSDDSCSIAQRVHLLSVEAISSFAMLVFSVWHTLIDC